MRKSRGLASPLAPGGEEGGAGPGPVRATQAKHLGVLSSAWHAVRLGRWLAPRWGHSHHKAGASPGRECPGRGIRPACQACDGAHGQSPQTGQPGFRAGCGKEAGRFLPPPRLQPGATPYAPLSRSWQRAAEGPPTNGAQVGQLEVGAKDLQDVPPCPPAWQRHAAGRRRGTGQELGAQPGTSRSAAAAGCTPCKHASAGRSCLRFCPARGWGAAAAFPPETHATLQHANLARRHVHAPKLRGDQQSALQQAGRGGCGRCGL